KSPRVPPLATVESVGGLVVRSMRVTIPSLRLAKMNGGRVGSDPAATAVPSLDGTLAMNVTAPGDAALVPATRPTDCARIAAYSVPSGPNVRPSVVPGLA